MIYEDPIQILEAKHKDDGVVIQMSELMGGTEYRIPANHVWHVFDVLRSHIRDYGAVDAYGREIATEDI